MDDEFGNIEAIIPNGNNLELILKEPFLAEKITYLPDKYYNDSDTIYNGPWLKNERGIGALSFYEFPISNPTSVDKEEDLPKSFKLGIYPNPFNPSTNISVFNPELGLVKIVLYDILGRKVKEVFNDKLEKGEHFLKLNMDGNSSGVYILLVSTNNKTISKKIQLLK